MPDYCPSSHLIIVTNGVTTDKMLRNETSTEVHWCKELEGKMGHFSWNRHSVCHAFKPLRRTKIELHICFFHCCCYLRCLYYLNTVLAFRFVKWLLSLVETIKVNSTFPWCSMFPTQRANGECKFNKIKTRWKCSRFGNLILPFLFRMLWALLLYWERRMLRVRTKEHGLLFYSISWHGD